MAPCGEVNPALQWVTHSSYLLGKQKETSKGAPAGSHCIGCYFDFTFSSASLSGAKIQYFGKVIPAIGNILGKIKEVWVAKTGIQMN